MHERAGGLRTRVEGVNQVSKDNHVARLARLPAEQRRDKAWIDLLGR